MAQICYSRHQTKGVSSFLLFIFGLFFLLWASTPVLAKKAQKSTLKIVKTHFSTHLRVNFQGRVNRKNSAQIDLVSDFLMDRGKVYYALVDLYQKWNVKGGDLNLTNLGQIALTLEKLSPALKKKKKRKLLRGFFASRDNSDSASGSATTIINPAAPTTSRGTVKRGIRGLNIDDTPKSASVHNTKTDNSYVQTVFYATNRARTGQDTIEAFYNGKRLKNGKMHYGLAKVNIPFTHKKGRLERPWMGYKALQNEKQHIYLRALNGLDEKQFFSKIKAKPNWKGSEKDLLVYVHGFNVDFHEAILRAGQIAFDFGFSGTPIAFSWPSEGEATSYNVDRADALYSAKYLEVFLEKLSAKNPGRKIHIIAHSMGNQALLHGLRLMAYKNDKKRFSSIILAAPDFDAELFSQQIAQEIRPLAQSWAIYTSNKDSALWASENYNAVKRLGTPLSIVDGYQIIDASELEVTPWNLAENHSYYATKRVILEDMVKVLKGLLPMQRGLVASGSAWKPK